MSGLIPLSYAEFQNVETGSVTSKHFDTELFGG